MCMLIDETSAPSLRAHITRLLATCSSADIAVGSIRPAGLDLTAAEVRDVRRCRILIGRLDASALVDLGHDRRAPARMKTLLDFLTSGRVQVRSAGIGAWSPDFSVYHATPNDGSACLIGAHYFSEPLSSHGPSFTALLTDRAAVAAAAARFERLWSGSHDVIGPVIDAIRQRQSFCAL